MQSSDPSHPRGVAWSLVGDPAWPAGVRPVLERSVTAEFATVTRTNAPVTVPVTPFVEAGRPTIDLSTGLTYPAKAERARRDPRVCLLFADPVGCDLKDPPVVLVQGLATVRDADLQANTDRYVRASGRKLPATTEHRPRFVLRRMPWYFVRIWIEVTPLHMTWWPSRDLDEPPSHWDAPEGTAAPLSDPAPAGRQPGAWLEPPRSWRSVAAEALMKAHLCDVTVIDSNGFPLCVPVRLARIAGAGLDLVVGEHSPHIAAGAACVTFHNHPQVFTGQENRTIVGTLSGRNPLFHLEAERALAHWSLPGGSARVALGFLNKGRKLSKRLAGEAARRSQQVPAVRFPRRA